MKKYRWVLSLALLALAALACNAVMGGGRSAESNAPAPERPAQQEVPTLAAPKTAEATEESADDDGYGYDLPGSSGSSVQSEFPLPEDASSLMELGEAGINFQTGMNVQEAMNFYRDAFGKQGLKERDLLTVVSDGVFSMVFDGHSSGKSVVIQGVDLGSGTLNINIRLENVP
jgi:hypothetical protein